MRGVLFLLLLLVVGTAACQSGGPMVEHEEARNYRFTFSDGTWLKGPAIFHCFLTLASGEEFRAHLEGANGEMAALVASRWVGDLERMRSGLAKASSNSFVLYGVRKIELLSPLRGLDYKEIGVSR